MPDPRITHLARILIHYSLEIKPGQRMRLITHPLAEELSLALYAEAIQAGAHVFIQNMLPGEREIFLKYASEAQLDDISPVDWLICRTYDAELFVMCEHNTRELSGITPERIARNQKTYQPLMKEFLERAARKELHWCLTAYPSQAMAQEADLSLSDYREFVFGAGMLNLEDPLAYWQEQGRRQEQIAAWLTGKEHIELKGSQVDLAFSVKDRTFISADGKENFPDGEVFTGPVEASANGWIRFRYPGIMAGQEVTDIELWLEQGKVVKEQAGKNQELLTSLLDTDAGSRFLGEFGIGTNYGIQRFTKNILFDEKLGGTIHLALGNGYPETGSVNESGLHWDMLCDMNDAEMRADGELFYKDGRLLIP